jgi:hypothetical protein
MATAAAGSEATPSSIVGLPAWDVVPARGEALHGVHAVSSDDVWAVGTFNDRTLTEHWDGVSFTPVPSPSRPGRANTLEDVDGVGASDLWAVGHSDVIGFVGALTLAEHWDGTAWRAVPTPNVGGKAVQNELTGVAVIAPNDAWAVGTATDFRPGAVPLTFHWDGSRWTRVPSPQCGFGLTEVDALGSNDVWAVGPGDFCHWDGVQWTHADAGELPNPQASLDLQDITVVGPANAWAVGLQWITCGEGQVCPSGEVQRWNGARWSHVNAFVPLLYGVDAVAANDIWAVGQDAGPGIVHYDGQSWSQVPAGTDRGVLQAVDASAPDDIWAAGDQAEVGAGALVEHAPSPTSGAVTGRTNVGGATISWFGEESGSTQTDPFGDYQAGGLPAGVYTFTASYTGCQPAIQQVSIQAGTTIEQDFHLQC